MSSFIWFAEKKTQKAQILKFPRCKFPVNSKLSSALVIFYFSITRNPLFRVYHPPPPPPPPFSTAKTSLSGEKLDVAVVSEHKQ